ncbi:AbiJ-NTD4 domain-containing protein [Acinetobacter sp. TY2]|uniref:AbiJ-NTD4 domain-containing protein n=1 Tax=Acinetobacter sp. TY2 TaxID=3387403 RepID=UPI003917A5A6
MRFSERYGYKPVREIIQKESMDDDLKNKLWSILFIQIFEKYSLYDRYNELFSPLIINIWIDLLKLPLDEKPSSYKFTIFMKEYLYRSDVC